MPDPGPNPRGSTRIGVRDRPERLVPGGPSVEDEPIPPAAPRSDLGGVGVVTLEAVPDLTPVEPPLDWALTSIDKADASAAAMKTLSHVVVFIRFLRFGTGKLDVGV